MQAITTSTRGLFVTYFCSTVNIDTASYQYCSYLYYQEKHLRKYICFYCRLTYDDYVILNVFYFEMHISFHFSQITVQLWYFWTQAFNSRQRNPQPSMFDHQKQVQKPSSCYPNQETSERLRTIIGWLIVMREILNQTYITWLQVKFGNIMHPVSVSDWPGLERTIFFILIVYQIIRSALLLVILLCASNCHYNKGPVCYVFPFCIQYCYVELSKLLLFIWSQDKPE